MSAIEQKPRLLIVDDEPTVLRSLTWLLKKDYEITQAGGGQDAIELIRSQSPFDTIICDCRMPDVTGIEVLREAKERHPQTTRILLTGYAELNSVVGSVNESEVFRFVGKPWNNSDLRSIVSDAVDLTRRQGLEESLSLIGAKTDSEFAILVIDENPQTFDQLKSALGDKFPFFRAQDPKSALELMAKERIGVIITETGGENVASLGAAREVKERYPEVVLLVLSEAKDAYLVIDLINELQVFRYLLKPLKAGLLKNSLEAAGQKLAKTDLTSGRGQVAQATAPAARGASSEAQAPSRGVLSRLFKKLLG